MKRFIIALSLCSAAFAAGTVQQSLSQLGNTNNWVLSFQWTGDPSTGSVPVTVGITNSCCAGYQIVQAETVPLTPNPTSGYALQVLDSAGVDALAGAANSLSATSPQSFSAAASSPPLQGTFSISISGQSVASAKGVVYVFLSKPGTVNLASVGHGGTIPNPLPQGLGGTGTNAPLTGTIIGHGSGPFTAVPTTTADYIFPAQTPGGSLTVGSNTITMAPCRVSGSAVAHNLYISGGLGAAEAVLITGGTCAVGASSGTVIVTTANTHSGAWTIQSATSGLAECHDAVGFYGACAMPSGNLNLYGPYTNSNCSSLYGQGSFQTVLNVQFATGNPITFSGAQCILIDTRGYGVGYQGLAGFGPDYMTSGNMLSFVNLVYGSVDDISAWGASVAFQMTGIEVVQFHDLRGFWKGGACISVSGSGPLNLPSAPAMDGIYCGAADNTGSQLFVSGAIDGGMELNHFFFQGGSNTCLNIISSSSSTPVNEGIFSDGDCDGAVNGIFFQTAGGSNNMNQFSNIRVHATTGQALFVNGGNVMFDHMHLESATIGPAAVISNATNVYLRNSDIISGTGAGTQGLQLQATVTNSVFTGLTVGYNSNSGTSGGSQVGLATDATAHAGNYFANNKFFGSTIAVVWASTGAGNLFAPGQIGLSVPAVASASTVAFPPFPNFTLTGTTAVTAVSGLQAG
jgi:hypothetical protein